ncbi:uncharacterized protein RAG0_07112 [Rhynchosporium agropyri]|uniref:Uncharacterized protein n=1 Tax=Rhynchosporium agropyri TaxID=914238 RepID=A0A1E1KJW5_9HELO|nr:uncharacterized protein RAG0_07112 [Rhynchosporium agropyri]
MTHGNIYSHEIELALLSTKMKSISRPPFPGIDILVQRLQRYSSSISGSGRAADKYTQAEKGTAAGNGILE